MAKTTQPFTPDEKKDMLYATDESWVVEELIKKLNDVCESLRVLDDENVGLRGRVRMLEKHEEEG